MFGKPTSAPVDADWFCKTNSHVANWFVFVVGGAVGPVAIPEMVIVDVLMLFAHVMLFADAVLVTTKPSLKLRLERLSTSIEVA